MKAGAEYGIMTAESNYHYVVMHGSAYFEFYNKDGQKEDEWYPLGDEDAIIIPEGMRFSYRAAEHLGDTEMVLFYKTE